MFFLLDCLNYGDVEYIPGRVKSGRGRATPSRLGKFLRERISEHGDLVSDADAAETAPHGELCRLAVRDEPAQRLVGGRSRR
jgi:hypothetical protein